ncbi:MAG: hypothetical protein ACTSWN_15470 [Promethearchaeota archaeon]
MSDSELLKNFKGIMEISQRVKQSQVAKYLGITEDELFAKLIKWRHQIPFKIDADLIVVDDITEFTDALDREFASWKEKEQGKIGKLDDLPLRDLNANDTIATVKKTTDESIEILKQEELKTIVLDIDTINAKFGFAGEDKPRGKIPSHFGYKLDPSNPIGGISPGEYYFGDDLISKKSSLVVKKLFKESIFDDFNRLEKFLNHIFLKELRINPQGKSVLMSIPILTLKGDLMSLAELMFETFELSAFYVSKQPLLAMYGSGRITACSVVFGDTYTQILPIVEGFPIDDAAQKFEIGVKHVIDRLERLLLLNYGYRFGNFKKSEKEFILRDIKEKTCYFASDVEREFSFANKNPDSVKRTYQLPNGKNIELCSERFLAPEIYFDPSFIGKDVPPLHEQIANAILSVNVNDLDALSSNIILAGYTATLPGLKERVENELQDLEQGFNKVKVHQLRKDATKMIWLGGSIIASLKTFENIRITATKYKEKGSSVILECF